MPAAGQEQGGDDCGADYCFIAVVTGGLDDGFIDLTQPNGHHIDHLAPGQYKILFRDQSTVHNFALTGPHIECVGRADCRTSVEGTSEEIWTVRFYDEGISPYKCDVHPALTGTVHLHGTPLPPPPPPGGPPPAPPPPAPPEPQPDLIATVGPGQRIELFHADGRVVTHLQPGQYAIQVHDFSPTHNFHLTGPGVNLWTSTSEIEHPIWTLNLTTGTYRFVCDTHALSLRGSFTVGIRPPPAPPRCRVPRVVGKTLVTARRLIRRSNCAVGRVRYARSTRPRGRIVSQAPRAGVNRVRGTKVALVVSRGRRTLATRGTPDLIGRVLEDFTIDLRFPGGGEVTTIPAGTYAIEVQDQSTLHNFRLTGMGFNQATGVETIGTVTWIVNLVAGPWHFQCDPHFLDMFGDFTVTGGGPPPPPPPPPPAPPPPPPPAPPPPPPPPGVLVATVGTNNGADITLTQNGVAVQHIPPGAYTIEVRDRSAIHNFHLSGPSVNRATEVAFVGTQTWSVTLSEGSYLFVCDPHSSTMRGSFTVGTGPAPPPPPPPPAQPPRRCIVPRVVGRTLPTAQRLIRRRGCRVGRVRRVRSTRARRGRVMRQTPRAGRRVVRGTRIALVVGRGRR